MASIAHPQTAADNAPGNLATGISSRSDVADLVRFYSILIPLVLSAYVAFGAMYLVGLIPGRDNVDDVGLSLIRGYLGYSEVAEQRAFASFVVASLLGGLGFSYFLKRLSNDLVLSLGKLFSWVLIATLLFYYRKYLPVGKLLVFAFASLVVFSLGRTLGVLRIDREKWAFPGLLLAIAIWAITFDSGTYVFLRMSAIEFCVAVVLLIVLGIFHRNSPRQMASRWPIVTTLACLTLFWISCTRARYADLLIVAGLALLFVSACSEKLIEAIYCRVDSLWRYSRQSSKKRWLFTVLLALGLIEAGFTLTQVGSDLLDIVLLTSQGISLGLLLYFGNVEQRLLSLRGRRSWPGELVHRRSLLPALIVIVALFRGSYGIWLGLCVTLLAALIQHAGRFRLRPVTSTGVLLAAILAMALLPEFANTRGFDRFHDGQVLSGIWEFEQGEPLYSRMLPLRSTQLFVGWLSRRFVVPTMGGTFLLEKFADAACAAGACLVAFAWCRSPLWSVVIGLMVQPGGEVSIHSTLEFIPFVSVVTGLQVPSFGDPREGALLLISGIACEALRRGHSRLSLVVLGLPACLGGYDVMASYLGGLGFAAFCGQFGQGKIVPSLRKGVFAGTLLVLVTIAVFTGLLAVLQGFESAYAFWQVFFDYCRHFSSFCGTPFQSTRYIDIELLGLAIFAASGVICWKQRSRRRREIWGYVLACGSLFWFRALGRSDFGHVAGPLHMLHLMWCLNTVDFISILTRYRVVTVPRLKEFVGATLLVLLVFTAGPTSNPWRFFQQYLNAISATGEDVQANEKLDQLIAPDEYLWAVDDGIANYLQRRHNPTRHGQAICISSPNEQRVAIRDLQLRAPKAIVWEWTPHDDIHGLTRQYILGNFVLRNYRPDGDVILLGRQFDYAVPAESSWPGLESIPEFFNSPQELEHLPRIWAEYRWPKLANRLNSQSPLEGWAAMDADRLVDTAESIWKIDVNLVPRQLNYLRLELAVEPGPDRNLRKHVDEKWTTVRLEFDIDDGFNNLSETSWTCPLDGDRHCYLIPIGCHPGWTWRSAIRQIRLLADDDIIQDGIDLQVLDIDEISAR